MADPASQSNFVDIRTEHVHFEWTLDFEKKVISGYATHSMRVVKDGVAEAIFDTSDLEIFGAEVNGEPVKFTLDKKHPVMGSALHVPVPSGAKEVKVKVDYKTTAACTALQWLEKEQTQGKTFPYLFSQCQPIYARALAPLQDSSSNKIIYSANIKSTLPLVLSAIRKSPPSDGPAHGGKEIGKEWETYSYTQPVPIPPYLIAIAAGNLRYKPLPKPSGRRWTTGIWAEPELIDAAYWEFSEDTGRFLAAEEDLVGTYRFGVYDLLVLPPSFPYGGMENACISFLTPTLLTGDRTLVDVVVHELTHSWFGNGITQANSSHFWLNEGWTTYMERVLQEKLHSPAERGFAFVIGSKALYDALKQYETRPKYQRLVIEYEHGEDPDDAYSSIAYEKGANFILYLERTLGGLEIFLPYVRDYVNTFSGKSITTWEWKDHLYAYWAKVSTEKVKALDSIDWDAWLHGEGLELPVKIEYDTSLAEAAYSLASKWDQSRDKPVDALDFKEDDLKDFNANQIIVFLEKLQFYPSLPSTHIQHLGKLYKLSSTSNAEIRLRFYEVALLDPASPSASEFAKEAAEWVVGHDGTGVIKGRMKFCRPIFRSVSRVQNGGKDLARSVWRENRDAFHPIAKKLIEKDIGFTS